MNGLKVEIKDLSSEVAKLVRKYHGDVCEVTKSLIKKTAREASDKLEEKSPKLTGNYAKHWTYGDFVWDTLGGSIKVYVAEPEHRLSHLLEYGHANRGGGRTPGRPFIKPVEEKVKAEFEKNLEAVLSNV